MTMKDDYTHSIVSTVTKCRHTLIQYIKTKYKQKHRDGAGNHCKLKTGQTALNLLDGEEK